MFPKKFSQNSVSAGCENSLLCILRALKVPFHRLCDKACYSIHECQTVETCGNVLYIEARVRRDENKCEKGVKYSTRDEQKCDLNDAKGELKNVEN